MSRFYVAALAGRSGAGKSFASAYLEKKGVPVVDGDDVARAVVGPGSPCLAALVREFSADILLEDGSLNRRLLGERCFADADKKRRLDEITHPFIIERMLDRFDELHEKGYAYCLVEAPALIESGLYAVCDRIILVTAGEDVLVGRIMARDGLSREQAQTRVRAQMAEDAVRKLSDAVVENTGTPEEFCKKLDELKVQLDIWFKK